MRKGIALLHRQRIHVGAQADRARAAAGAQHPDDAGAPDPAMRFDAERLEPGGNELGGAVLGKGQLRVGVDVLAEGGKMGSLFLAYLFDDVHELPQPATHRLKWFDGAVYRGFRHPGTHQ